MRIWRSGARRSIPKDCSGATNISGSRSILHATNAVQLDNSLGIEQKNENRRELILWTRLAISSTTSLRGSARYSARAHPDTCLWYLLRPQHKGRRDNKATRQACNGARMSSKLCWRDDYLEHDFMLIIRALRPLRIRSIFTTVSAKPSRSLLLCERFARK